MPETLWCAPDIHMAAIDDDIVILDLAGDQYCCLLHATGIQNITGDGAIVARDAVTARELQALDLARPHPPDGQRSTIIPPCRELPIASSPPPKAVLHAFMALALAALAFRGKDLADLVRHDASAGGVRRDASPDDLSILVGAARRARPWIPFEGECLQRTFQLRSLLARRGVAADWIFGVRTWPFSAHCWLQIDDLVIGDRLERVRRYTPIMRA
jgi:hypothetical protein